MKTQKIIDFLLEKSKRLEKESKKKTRLVDKVDLQRESKKILETRMTLCKYIFELEDL